ncbi:HAMP domain-containing sensor histidine kinase [Streptomyces sp. NPDC005917]|uniref:sensor histidine kinase n=1 Tax=unclassified Streptomyces TaxID=2593676 RepID=UPI0033DF9B23
MRSLGKGTLAARLPLPLTLRARLTAGLVALLALACAAVGVTSVVALNHFQVRRLDQQLSATEGRFAASMEHEHRPDFDNQADTRGQSYGTFGARLHPGQPTRAAVVRDGTDASVPLTAGDRAALAAVPPGAQGHTVMLSGLGHYRVVAVHGDESDVLITGLPMRPAEETIHRLETVEIIVFATVLIVTGVAGALWVRLSLRPLARVTATAQEVVKRPLASGEVAMPDPVPQADPHTEVGRVGSALNGMLGHVGDALARRHASEERLRHFAADASHELRTPVATVRAHTELALRHSDTMTDEVRHALTRIQSESRRMSGLVDDLLLLARLDAGRPLARETVDLTRLVLDATDDARVAGPDHRWILNLPEEPVTVIGDPHRLHQVVANLLANARIHTPPGTNVSLRLDIGAEAAQLTITDDGTGIPETFLPDLFERFSRADPSRSRSAGGTGLGLAIVAAVVQAHHGSVEVTSRPGNTAFDVRLPKAEPEGPLPANVMSRVTKQ